MEWRDVVGFCGDYQVSDCGDVRSMKTGHCRSIRTKHNRFTGYDFVNLTMDGKSYTKTIHRIVAEAFIPNPSGFSEVNHKDENKTNNCVGNLEWCSRRFNHEYSIHKLFKPIDCYTTDGELLATFSNETVAANFAGVGKACMSNHLNGKSKTCAGLVFKKRGESYGDTSAHHGAVRVREVNQYA